MKDEPAFPKTKSQTGKAFWSDDQYVKRVYSVGGLTKREYFAGLAMQGMVARGKGYDKNVFVESAIEIADALIAELSKDEELEK